MLIRPNCTILLCLFLFCSVSFGATYYVADGNGESCSDSNTGTSPTSPWCHCPGQKGWSGTTALQPGDIVYFENTGKWVYSYSTGSPFLDVVGGVQYIGNQWPSVVDDCVTGDCAEFEAGTDFPSDTSEAYRFININDDDVNSETVIRGLELDSNNEKVGWVGINQPASTGKVLTGTYKIVENCYMHDEYHDSDSFTYGIRIGTGGNDQTGFNTENVKILNNVLWRNSRDLLVLYPANNSDHTDNWIKNVLIKGNDIRWANCNSNPCSDNSDNSYASGNGIALKNRMYDVIIEDNYIQGVHGSAITVGVDSSYYAIGPNDITIRNNILRDATNTGHTVKFKSAAAESVTMYNNLITGGDIFLGEGLDYSSTFKIYNNSVYNSSGHALQVHSSATDLSEITFELKNNILYSADSAAYYDSADDRNFQSFVHSNNVYYTGGFGNVVDRVEADYTMSNITSWESTAIAEDCYKNVSNLPTGFVSGVPNADGMSISNTSEIIDKGVDLSSSFNTSINGVLRPQGSAWDIGAYEYVWGNFLGISFSGGISTQ